MEDRVLLTGSAPLAPTALLDAAGAGHDTPHEQTVTRLYQDLLHRLPDAGGLGYWAGRLDAGADTPSVAAALTHSTEFHRGEVDGVYQRLLNRAADDGGRAFFASALDHGQTVPQVEASVAASPEYAHSHPGASGFLDALFNGTDHLKTLVSGAYQQVLHRAGDAGGLDYWAGRLAAGASLGDVTASLAASPEKAAQPAPTSTVLGTFGDASALPLGGVGALEASLSGSVHAALGAGASGLGTGAAPLGALPQAVTLKNGLPAVFQAFGPERLVDTRNPAVGQYGGPDFTAGGTRTINVAPYNLADPSIPSAAIGDQPPTSNLPANVVAVSVILFVVIAPQPEYFTAYATGTSPAPIGTATVFADHAGQIIAASAIVPVNSAGNIDVYSSGGGTLIIDVTGYFLNTLDGTDNLPISGNVPGGAGNSGVVVGTNADTSNFANGVTGIVSSTAQGRTSAGVRGINNGTGPLGIGVYGSQKGNGYGVEGTVSGAGVGGVFLANGAGTGVLGSAFGGGSIGGNFSAETGVSAFGTGTAIIGTSSSTSATATAIMGTISSAAAGGNSAGVRGINAGNGIGVWGSAAGTGNGWGVYGTAAGFGIGGNFSAGTSGFGVQGISSGATSNGGRFVAETGVNAAGVGAANIAVGVLGVGPRYGVVGRATDATGGFAVSGQASGADSFGVFAFGNSGASGTKSFVEPDAIDSSKQIRYVSLEGPEAGTYFRGTGHFANGTATINVPESFRLVTDPTGLSIHVEPIGALANTAVQSLDLTHIVVLGSADVDFFYTVNGVRKGFQGFNPIETNTIYVPRSASDSLPTWLTDTQKQELIANGTYNADGTVNLMTAHRLGWDQLWSTNHATANAS